MTITIHRDGTTSEFDYDILSDKLETFSKGYDDKVLKLTDFDNFKERLLQNISRRDEITSTKIRGLTSLISTEYIDENGPDWAFFAANSLANDLYSDASHNRGYSRKDGKNYGDYYSLIKTLTEKGIYHPRILKSYTRKELKQFGKVIDPSRDRLFTYSGLYNLNKRYLAADHEHAVFELPQERWMTIALWLMIDEKDEKKRTGYILEVYWALSNLYMTVATPTLSNAGKTTGQLSSCFIDTVGDSLDQIFDANGDFARVSKAGGGMGEYIGSIRSKKSNIQGYKGIASGVIPWMRQFNNTAVSVDQLGLRKGSVAIYLDVWHKDIFAFLDAKLNNGDERQRTHDVFTAVCLPDIFMEAARDRKPFYLFDPHEVKQVMGYSLEDYYDQNKGSGEFRKRYQECVEHPDINKTEVQAIDIYKSIIRSRMETGTPYMYYRDNANRANPNSHAGIIYGSNLCSEILQNMTPTVITEKYIENDDTIVTKQKAGDFVVCNLSSINLGRAVPDNVLERLIKIQVRMLDNVIDLNKLDVLQASITNNKYRAIGLGTFGWHHLLALKGIRWESQEAVDYSDELYEKIAYLTISASADLSKEKGSYKVFSGSDWETGEYFKKRSYIDTDGNNTEIARHDWSSLANRIKKDGLRNAYLMAVAPNGTTSIIAGSTASIDPVFDRAYSDEKKDSKIPVTVPDLNEKTVWFYKSGYVIDQKWSIRQNAARQRHIDQGISFNFYVHEDIPAKELLELDFLAWSLDMKTTYYTRSLSQEDIDDCEACQ